MLRPALLILMLSATTAQALETRCGWLDNPTPANWWLTDADGEWFLSMQGMGEAPGFFNIEWLGKPDWVERNGSYGYGCMCINVEVDHETRWVTRVDRVEWIGLARCHGDPALPDR